MQGLRAGGHDPAGKRVLLVGAGGAGVAIAAALVQSGVQRLVVVDTSTSKADDLASRLNAYGIAMSSTDPHLECADLAINATPIGLRPGDPLPFEIGALQRHAIVADIIMKPAETALLQAASRSGLVSHPGIHMLIPQIQMYGEFFRVVPSTN